MYAIYAIYAIYKPTGWEKQQLVMLKDTAGTKDCALHGQVITRNSVRMWTTLTKQNVLMNDAFNLLIISVLFVFTHTFLTFCVCNGQNVINCCLLWANMTTCLAKCERFGMLE